MTAKSQVFGLPTLASLVVANMIGAGVFTTSGFALGDLGSPYRVLAVWAIGGLLALCGALSYGALSRLIPESGGEYLFLSRAIHPAAGFVAGWVSLLAGFTGAIAFAALTFSAYVIPASSGPLAANGLSTLVITVAVLMHVLRVRQGAWLQNAAVAVKLVLMLGFCGYAAFGPGSQWAGLAQIRDAAYQIPPFSIATFAVSLMWISFSYLGFNAAVYLADEVKSAREQIPRALLVGTGLTVVVYLAVNTVFLLVPPFEAVAFQEDIAAVAAEVIGGMTLANVVRGTIALALFTSVSAMIMIGPRVYAKMADDGLLPRRLRFSGDAPVAAIVMQGVLAVAVVWVTDLRELLSYLGFTLGLSTAATVATLFVVVRRGRKRSLVVPGYPWAPAIFVVLTLLFATLAATINPWEMLAALITISSGGMMYRVTRGRWSSGGGRGPASNPG